MENRESEHKARKQSNYGEAKFLHFPIFPTTLAEDQQRYKRQQESSTGEPATKDQML